VKDERAKDTLNVKSKASGYLSAACLYGTLESSQREKQGTRACGVRTPLYSSSWKDLESERGTRSPLRLQQGLEETGRG
jgi:hypothetical protein